MHKIKLKFVFFLVLFSLAFSQTAGATIYEPGETLEPDCAPNSINCGVATFSLNSQIGSTQTLVAGSTGTDFSISSAGNIHSFNLPSASALARGLLTAADWLIFNGKQDALVSGTNIKTIGGVSLLGSGDIATGGTGTVTDVSVVSANGVSGSVATSTTTPAITLTLGAITPTTVNSITFSGSATPTLAVTGTSSVSGTNTGDQDLSGFVPYIGATADVDLGNHNLLLGIEDGNTSIITKTATTADSNGSNLAITLGDGLGNGSGGSLTLNLGQGAGSGSNGLLRINGDTQIYGNAIRSAYNTGGTDFNMTLNFTGLGFTSSLGDSASYTEGGIELYKAMTGGHSFYDADSISFIDPATSFYGTIFPGTSLSADRSWSFPDASGTIALTSDITGINSGTNTGDQDLSGLLVKANNLSDLVSIPTARTNLGLGSLATQSGTFSGISSGTNTGDQTITLTGGVTGSGTGSFATTVITNANLTGVITSVGNATSVASQTGTGSTFVMDTSPTLVTPILGTPTSVTLTNATGLPITGITSSTSAQLATLISDETGSGALVFATSPVFTTPNIGSATGSITGNAGTATALQTARTINGVSFDGTAGITVTAAAGTLTGATLAANVLNSSLTSVGTLSSLTLSGAITGATGYNGLVITPNTGIITTGTWNGTTIAIANGGTGQTTANTALNALLPTQTGNSGKVLSTDGSNTSWISASGTGTVTSVTSANGDATVATTTTTPVITIVSAPKLTTARTIGGVSFDGTVNITVASATGGFTVSGGNLALGANNITMAGTITGATGYNGLVITPNTGIITTGTWNGTTIAVANGGTGTTNGSITGTGALSFTSNTTNALTLDSGTTGAINIGTNANAKTITMGNTTGATRLNLTAGTGGIFLTGLGAQANGHVTVCVDSTTFQLFLGLTSSCNTSSSVYKHDIQDISLGLEAINALRPVSYVYNSNNEPSLGFIAEEAALVDQRLIERNNEGVIIGINSDEFVPILTKGIQEQQVLLGDISPAVNADGTDNGLSTLVADIQAETTHDPVAIIVQKITDGKQFLTDFISARVTAIRGYFDEVFSKKVHTEQVCVKKSDGSEVCVNGDQLDALLQNGGITPAPDPIPIPGPIPPYPNPISKPRLDPILEPIPVSDPISEIIPEPTSDPMPEPVVIPEPEPAPTL